MATIKGKWKFNNIVSTPPTMYSVNFTSNSASFDAFSVGGGGKKILYMKTSNMIAVYNSTSGWSDENYKEVDFGTTEQEVSDDFYNWFTPNATQIIDEPTIDEPTIKTLKNTTWKFGEYLLSDYTTSFSYNLTYSVVIKNNGEEWVGTNIPTSFPFSADSRGNYNFPSTTLQFVNGGVTTNTAQLYYGYDTAPRISSQFRTNFDGVYITFLDGTDIDNPNAIAWVQANANQVIDEEPEEETTEIPNLITLAGITVKPKGFPIQEVSGVLPDNPYTLSVEVNGITYTSFAYLEDAIYLSNDSDSLEILDTTTELKIVGGADATNPNMINFIRTNFNAVSGVVDIVTVKYKNIEKVVQAGLTASLNFANKKMTEDVVITFTQNGVIEYKGVETTVQAGQTATLKCANKKITEDLYITVGISV